MADNISSLRRDVNTAKAIAENAYEVAMTLVRQALAPRIERLENKVGMLEARTTATSGGRSTRRRRKQ